MKSPRKIALITIGVIAIIGFSGGIFAMHQQSKATQQPRIVATTYAVVQIADRLKLPLVGVPTTSNKMPVRYKAATRIGNPMSPSAEKIASLHPTAIYSVTTLKDQFGKSFKQQHLTPHFLNLTSVADLKQTVQKMGKHYHRQTESRQAVAQINQTIKQARRTSNGHAKPRVLVLMGLPGAGYMVETNQSYIGDLVRLAGGQNVFTSKSQEVIQPSNEAIKKANPQVVLRLEHAMPKMVTAQFNSEFKINAVWRQTAAVKNQRVYDLQEPDFDATANMHASTALKRISNWLYPRG